MVDRFPWAEETTVESFNNRLARVGGRLGITLKSGEEVWAVKCRRGVVWLEGAGKVRLSKLVWTPVGYEEIDSDETDPQKRALIVWEQWERRNAIAALDTGRNPLTILSRRLREEQEAQAKAGSKEWQTLDPLTEKVIVSWLRDLACQPEAATLDADDIADMIEAGDHRDVATAGEGGDAQ